MSSKLRRWCVPLGAAAAILFAGATPALAGAGAIIDPGPIAPNQLFVGVVNGNTVASRIAVICDGPIDVVATGHPLAGQTVSVRQVFSTTPAVVGSTGTVGKAIGVGLGASASTTPPVVFRFYDTTAQIPTDVIVPCSGDGLVTFTPAPTSLTARAATVKVIFVKS